MYLQHYAWIIKRRLWLILVGMILCVGATGAITYARHPVFEATTTIEAADPGTDVFGNQADAVTYALEVTNASVLEAVVSKVPGTTLISLQNDVSAFPIDQTQLIAVQVDASSPQQAVTIANTVAQIFIQQKLASETAQLQATATQLSSQVATAKAQMDQAQQQLTLLQQNGASPDQIQQETDLLETYQSNYDALSASYSNIQTQETLIKSSLVIDQLATPPTSPAGISKTLAMALAASLSLLLMLMLVLLLDWVDVTVKTPEDITQLAGLEPLGSIPASGNSAFPLPAGNRGDDLTEQAFAIITTHFQALYRGQRALLVTGFHHKNGSTTIATSLALTLAQSGMRVLLVDANLRQPALHQAFHVVNTRGLTNSLGDTYVLQKQPSELHNWLQKWTTQVPNLWLLPAGPASVSPTAVLRSQELQKLVNWLLQTPEEKPSHTQNTIDIIIFDAPPLLEAADATTLALLCDGTILVVEAARERKETLRKASAELQRLGTPILGVVLNRQKAGYRPYPYVDQSSLTISGLGERSAEALNKYERLQRSHQSLQTRPKVGQTSYESQMELAPTIPLPENKPAVTAASAPYQPPLRPLHIKAPEEQGQNQ